MLFIFLFTLTGCFSNKKDNKANSPNDNQKQDADTKENNEDDTFILQKAVPQNLPIYPNAILINDLVSYGDNSWQWFYSTTASGNEIVEFFITEFQKLGFTIDNEKT